MPRMRWDCERDGCFNRVQRPKIEVFDVCFPRSIAFGDIDAIVEMGGHFLVLEWKRPGTRVPRGQALLHERLTALSPAIVVVVIFGDAETMVVESLRVVRGGCTSELRPATLDSLKLRVAEWARTYGGAV